MKKRAGRSSFVARDGTTRAFWPLLITGVAVILFSTGGMARMMGWGADTASYPGAVPALDAPAGGARAGPRCPECGIVVSVREIVRHDEESSGNYEFIVRMADGSSRVIDSPGPVRWRMGESLMVIDRAAPLRP